MNPIDFLIVITILIFSAVFHEYAHGWTAYRLGDPTAKMLGRLSVNPIRHIDPFGTILLPIILYLLPGNFIFAMAKPVPVNFSSLNNPKRDMIWVGFSGPFTNLLIAVSASLILRLPLPTTLEYILSLVILINLILAVFNMMPIPPLDGSRVVMGLLPDSLTRKYLSLEKYGMIIVFASLFLGLFRYLVFPIVLIMGEFLGVNWSLLY